MGLVQHAAHALIVGMGRRYGMWVRAVVTRANAAMYCRYWVAHPRAVLAGGSQSGALSHRHRNTPTTLDSVHMMVHQMLGCSIGYTCSSITSVTTDYASAASDMASASSCTDMIV